MEGSFVVEHRTSRPLTGEFPMAGCGILAGSKQVIKRRKDQRWSEWKAVEDRLENEVAVVETCARSCYGRGACSRRDRWTLRLDNQPVACWPLDCTACRPLETEIAWSKPGPYCMPCLAC